MIQHTVLKDGTPLEEAAALFHLPAAALKTIVMGVCHGSPYFGAQFSIK
jgi:hypothetical protein